MKRSRKQSLIVCLSACIECGLLGTIVMLLCVTGCSEESSSLPPEQVESQKTDSQTNNGQDSQNDGHMDSSFAPNMSGMDIPGISDPYFHAADEVVVPDTTPVIGVLINGQPRAYMDEGMAEADQHIVHDLIGDQKLTIVYCDKSNCVRVFDSNDIDPDSILMSGMKRNQLLLTVGESDYPLDDESIPIPDYDSVRTTWGEWKTEHPDTDIYVGIGKMIGPTVKEGAKPPRKSDFGG